MNTNTSSKPPSNWSSVIRNTLAAVALTGLGMGSAMAAAPLAGSTIGNQAAATYTDASQIQRTATSNTVITTVSQVAGVTLVSGLNVTGAPGQPVSLPHTLTNTGNGTDTFALATTLTAGATAQLGAVSYFPDTNCDGVADSGSPAILSLGPLVAGARACFVGVTTIAGSSGSGSNIVTVSTAANGGATASNTDTVTVSTNAVIGVTKSASIAAATGGRTGVDITYTLSYTNTGNAAATDVMLVDTIPAGTTYITTTGRWSGSGATALTEATAPGAGVPTAGTITFDNGMTTTGAITARVGQVSPNSSGTLSFVVNVPAATLPGTINNTARFCYNNGVAVTPAGATSASCSTGGNPTNTVPYTVGATYGVIVSDYFAAPNLQGASAVTATASSTTDVGAVKNDIVTVAAAPQGGTVSFDNVVANTGNATDTFNISTSASGFPAGTTFLLFKEGGVTPLTDSNGDGIVDTGPLAPGAVYHVFVKAVLPGTANGGPFNVTTTATSVGNSAMVDTVTDSLTAVTANSVDLTNNSVFVAGGTNGSGVKANAAAAVAAGAIVTNAVNPGASTTLTLVVNNPSAIADTYGVTVDPASALPVGWSVNFYSTATDLNCSVLGAPLSNTGVVLGAGHTTVCAVVTVPATQAALPAGQNVVFKVASPTTLVQDFILDLVTVNTVRSISISPNNSSQVYPGGSVVYKHTLSNTGNVQEAGLTVAATMSGAATSWGSMLYADTNGNGALDAADAALTAVTLPAAGVAGSSITVFNKVLSPASAGAGDVNTVLLNATQPTATQINGVNAPLPTTSQDVTTVIAGQVGLTKLQQVDTACAGVAAGVWTNAPLTAKPGECVLYQITATNLGTANATTLVISDATPANTVYACKGLVGAQVAGTGAALVALTVAGTAAATATAPATCAAGTVSSGTIPSLAPGATAVMTFGVQVNP